MNKKINKMIRLIVAFCLIFSQISPVATVLADELTPAYDINLNLDDTYKLAYQNEGTKEFSSELKYIMKIKTSFTYVDGDEYLTPKTYYQFLDSTSLENGSNIQLATLEDDYNGEYIADISIYSFDETTTPFTGDETDDDEVEEFITTNDLVLEYSDSTNKLIDTFDAGLDVIVTGDAVTCTEHECIVDPLAVNKEVTMNFSVDAGDLNPNKHYYLNENTNGEIITITMEHITKIDFSKLLFGNYEISYGFLDEDNNLLYEIPFNFSYGDKANNDLDTYFDFDTNSDFYMRYQLISYLNLTEEEQIALQEGYNELRYNYYYKSLDNQLNYDSTIGQFNQMIEEVTISEEVYEIKPYLKIIGTYMGLLRDTDSMITVGEAKAYVASKIPPIPFIKISIIDEEGTSLEDTVKVSSKMTLRINNFGLIIDYPIYVYGDIDGGLVEKSDVEALIDIAIEENVESKITVEREQADIDEVSQSLLVDLLDATEMISAIREGSWEYDNPELTDNLDFELTNNNDIIRVGDEFEVTYEVSGLTLDKLNGIQGTLEYDINNLELISITPSSNDDYEWYGNYSSNTNKWLYVTEDDFDTDSVLLTFKFKALLEGDTTISINEEQAALDGIAMTLENDTDDIDLTIERALFDNNYLSSLVPSAGSISFDKTINEYTMYLDYSVTSISFTGAVEEEHATVAGLSTYNLPYLNNRINVTVTAENGETRIYTVNVIRIVPKSSNANIASLTITDKELDFNKDICQYSIDVDNDVNELDMTVVLEDPKANLVITGNENFKVGENIVTLTVTAENGTTKTYTITVNKKDKNLVVEDDNETKEEGTEKVVIIILIVLVVLGLLYLVFKKDEPNNKK